MTNPGNAPQPTYQQLYGVGPEDDVPSEFGKLPCPKRVTENVLGRSPKHGRKGRTGEPGTQVRG